MDVKKWLIGNKAYIDMFSSALIGIAAIMVSYASYTVSKEQLLLSDILIQPNFSIETLYILDPKEDKYIENELYIFNNGAVANNLNFTIKSFLVVEYIANKKVKIIHLPITGYYFAQVNHQKSNGRLVTFKGSRNNENFYRIYREFLKEKTQEKLGFPSIKLEHITIINYLDRKNTTKQVYFVGNNLSKLTAVSQRLKEHRKYPSVDIHNLTATQLMKEVDKYEKSL